MNGFYGYGFNSVGRITLNVKGKNKLHIDSLTCLGYQSGSGFHIIGDGTKSLYINTATGTTNNIDIDIGEVTNLQIEQWAPSIAGNYNLSMISNLIIR